MMTRRLVLGAVFAFLVAWGTLALFATWRTAEVSPVDAAQAPPAGDEEEPGSDVAPSTPAPLSREEIARHNHADDCWLIIRGRVYDVTSYISAHPAPRRTITDYCGGESTVPFEDKERGRPHSPHAWELLEDYYVGEASE